MALVPFTPFDLFAHLITMAELSRQKTYTFENISGWRGYRPLRPFLGISHDLRRRFPYYWTDIRDGFNYRTFAATVRIYFVNILPAIAFVLDMNKKTNGYYSINEALFSSALACFVFSLFSCQPLTVVGITGLISLFNYTIFDIVREYDSSVYPQVMAWTGIWSAIFHWIVAVCNLTDYMRYVTDFSSRSFAAYVGIIYIIKGVEEAISIFEIRYAQGFLSVLIAVLYFLTIKALEAVSRSTYFMPWIRRALGDYAYPIATIFWTGFSHIQGRLKNARTVDLPKTEAFYPTNPAGRVNGLWLIDFWNLSVGWIFVALPFGFLTMLLFYYDHNISSITAQARYYPLKKPAGFHWDFFLLGCTTFIGGVIGIPFPNGLVPQAPVHTDALACPETSVKKLKADDDNSDDTEDLFPTPVVTITEVKEQRVSHMLMCLAIVGTMTGPLLTVLATIPRAIFVGVFFIVGWGSIEGNPIVQKLLYLISEARFVPLNEPLRNVRKTRIAQFVGCQIIIVAGCVAISQTIAALGFPVIILAQIPIRWKLFPRWFTCEELQAMDCLTANSDVVLASLGGSPEYPEVVMRRILHETNGHREKESDNSKGHDIKEV